MHYIIYLCTEIIQELFCFFQLKLCVQCSSNLFKGFKLKKLVIDPKTAQLIELDEEPVDL